jgi:hypothetical protein
VPLFPIGEIGLKSLAAGTKMSIVDVRDVEDPTLVMHAGSKRRIATTAEERGT